MGSNIVPDRFLPFRLFLYFLYPKASCSETLKKTNETLLIKIFLSLYKQEKKAVEKWNFLSSKAGKLIAFCTT